MAESQRQTKNGMPFTLGETYLEIGNTHVSLPTDQDSRKTVLLAIALICADEIRCNVTDGDGEEIESYLFFD
jgi:hypothetical protein